ncbi:MAG: hypothetical protein AB1422_16230, partial [bacterium]
IINTGKFKQDMEVVSFIEGFNFSTTTLLSLLPSQKGNLSLSALIPASLTAGYHYGSVCVQIGSSSKYKQFSFYIPQAKLEVKLNDKSYQPGEKVNIYVKNIGGVADSWDYTIRLFDTIGNEVYTGEGSIDNLFPADDERVIGFDIPEGLITGDYIISLITTAQLIQLREYFDRYIRIEGIDADMSIWTTQKTYSINEQINVNVKIDNKNKAIEDAKLSLKVRNNYPGWQTFTALKRIYDIKVDGNYVWFTTDLIVKRYNKVDNKWDDYNKIQDANTIAVDGRYIWFGTWDGVSRYDKETDSWTTFNEENSGLVSNYIHSIAVDGKYIWFGTWYSGVSRYDKETGSWTTFNAGNSELVSNEIRTIAVDGRYIWFGAWGVSRYDKETGSWITFNKENSGLVSNNISSIAVDEKYIWFGTEYDGVSRYDKETGSWTTFNAGNSELVSNEIRTIAVDGRYIWFGAWGVSRYDKETGSWTTFTQQNSGLVSNNISSIALDEKYIWFGTDYAGVSRYDKEGYNWIDFTQQNSGLVSNDIWSIAVDDKYIWFGTDYDGVSRYDKETGSWTTFTEQNSGLVRNDIHSITVDGKYIWFGTWDGVSRYDKETGSWTTFNKNSGLESNDIWSIAVDGKYIWIGTCEGGVSRYDKETGSWTTFTKQNSGLQTNCIRTIAVDGKYIWIGTWDNDVSRYDKETGSWTTFTSYNSGLVGYKIRSIAVDGKYIWIGTRYGLSRYDKETGSWTTFTQHSIMSIAVDGKYIWIGTWLGVLRYDKETSSWTTFTPENSELVSNYINSIAVDGEYIWFGTEYGVSRYTPGGDVIYEKEYEITCLEANISQKVINIGTLSSVGKLYIEGVITSNKNQKIAIDMNSFYIFKSNLYLTFDTDKKVYKPDELITISGTLTNKGENIEAGDLELKVKDGDVIFRTPINLGSNSSYSFIATTTANSSFVLECMINDVKVIDYILVEETKVNIEIITKQALGRGTNTLIISLKNISQVDVVINHWSLAISDMHKEFATITIPALESKVIEVNYQLPITSYQADYATITLVLSGNVSGTYT